MAATSPPPRPRQPVRNVRRRKHDGSCVTSRSATASLQRHLKIQFHRSKSVPNPAYKTAATAPERRLPRPIPPHHRHRLPPRHRDSRAPASARDGKRNLLKHHRPRIIGNFSRGPPAVSHASKLPVLHTTSSVSKIRAAAALPSAALFTLELPQRLPIAIKHAIKPKRRRIQCILHPHQIRRIQHDRSTTISAASPGSGVLIASMRHLKLPSTSPFMIRVPPPLVPLRARRFYHAHPASDASNCPSITAVGLAARPPHLSRTLMIRTSLAQTAR